MNTKLTLSLDQAVIERAKEYAKSNKISLSRLIESYLASLVNKKTGDVEITPLVDSLSGVIELDENYNYKTDYVDFLMKKYK